MAADELVWTRRPDLNRPVLIVAFEGWNDAGEAASTAVRHLEAAWGAEPFATIDPENFYDFTSTRPMVRLVDGVSRTIDWPANTFSAGLIAGTNRHAVVLVGAEPQLRWRTFSGLVLEVANVLGVELVISLGALLADVPHSRPTRITGTTGDDTLIDRFDLLRSRYEGPTGIVGVLHERFATQGTSSCSLWATVPHYLPSTTSPKAALALVERATDILGVSVPTIDLQLGAVDYERQVNDVVETDDEMRGFVRTLEESYDDGDDDDDEFDDDEDDQETQDPRIVFMNSEGNLPTGDDLASELERFLREQ